MSKLLSQGGFGCVFYPGVDCRGKTIDDDTVVTKIQRKGFNSDNELTIGSLIHKQEEHELFFLPVTSSCDINLRKTSKKELSKCKILKDYKKKYVAMDMTYVDNIDFIDMIKRLNASDIILTLSGTYRYLLMALEKLTDINVVHYDLKLENIMFLSKTHEPRIIDFGISIPIDKLTKHNMKDYFYVYSPSYYVWCLDINVINFLLHETKGDLTEIDADSIAYLYVSSNRALDMFSPDFISQFLDTCIIQTKKYVGRPRDDVLQELLSYSNTWDNYSLSIIYLIVISTFFAKHGQDSKFVIYFTQLLLKNIHPDPTRRLSITETLLQQTNFLYIEDDVNNYLQLSKSAEIAKQESIPKFENHAARLKKLKTLTFHKRL